MRKALGMQHGQTGVLVKSVDPVSDAARVLTRGDIVTHIDGVAVSNAGTVPFVEQPGERICLTYLVTSRFVGDEVSVSIVRGGKTIPEKYRLPAMGSSRLVPVIDSDHERRRLPQYIVYGGLVFVSLSESYLESEFDKKWAYEAPVRLIEQHYYGRRTDNGRSEVVLLAYVLNSKINAGYDDARSYILYRFNGEMVRSLAHLAEMLDAAERDDTVPFLKFELDYDEVLILDKLEAVESLSSILKTHCIPQARNIDGHAVK
jgi:PDZ domain